MSAEVPEIGHIHFNLKRCSVKAHPINPKKQNVLVEIDGTFEDEAQWETIRQKLVEGVKIYVAEDFKGELMLAAHDELKEARREIERLRLENTKVRQDLNAAESELHTKNNLLQVLELELLGD